MYTYVLSLLDFNITDQRKEAEKLLTESLEKIITVPRDYTIQYSQIKHPKLSGFKATISEEIQINYSFLQNPLETTLNTEILILYETLKEGKNLMVSSPRGMGMIVRGPPRKYIDALTSRIMKKSLFLDKKIGYEPLMFEQEDMKFDKWGEELRGISMDIEAFGKVYLTGRELNNKIPSMRYITQTMETGVINKIKIFSEYINRIVEISSYGVVKINEKNIVKLSDYLFTTMKKIGRI